tara:strand:- start:4064 stop:7420 length:3357 start_codon:yes stop_codon:yes gene_type:complete
MSKNLKTEKVEEYDKKELKEHILFAPDTYAGGADLITEPLGVFEDGKIFTRDTEYIPVVFNMWNEIIVNARDQIVRLQDKPDSVQVTKIKINFDDKTGRWTIYNDGESIPVEKHSKENMYKAQLIFGELLTSSNYKAGEKKIVGGKNGYGAKITNIFSTEFSIETQDHIRKKNYQQTFRKNMTIVEPPKITNSSKKPYTKISWITDFQRFGLEKFPEQMIPFMIRRIYDIAGVTDKKISVYYNDEKINVKSFQDYTKLYPTNTEKIYEFISDRWELSACVSDTDKFEQVSFVNGIGTSKGGVHVDTIVKQISSGVVKYIKKKHKKDIPEKYIKNHLCLYLNSVIENPSFDSQTKERLITPKSKFGSKPEVSDKFIKKLCDSGLSEKVLQFNDYKENNIAKKTNGKKKSKIRDIPKLDDANWAGTRKSHLCTLILTEGDSAKSMAIAGLTVVGRDQYGVFPLKGKVLNVRDASIKQITGNAEITNIKKILGLESGKVYKDLKSLRYGKVMIMTDQDHDGSHIKGLILNLFHSHWPELLKLDYVNCMVTPIVKSTKGKVVKEFYTLTDYNAWKDSVNSSLWSIKYYKGLGTSNSKEAKEYFKTLKVNQYKVDEKTDDSMILAFKKTEADRRKEWLKTYDSEEILDYNKEETRVEDFIDREFKHFSNSDCLRSIGSVVDGLKVSQRKILYSCFKRKLYSEIRVAQLSGYVSENAAYHHGEASLQGAIVGMAQDFVGSNNINLLQPNGQFGTRIMGGSDAASARYIHTQLSPITDIIYPKEDFPLLDYLDDDGLKVEPKWYCPILPMVLVNGMVGIGTGFSTTIPQYNPLDCIKNIKRKLEGLPYQTMMPYYKGFTGKVIKKDSKQFTTNGKYTIEDDKIVITELPIGKWTDDFKEFIEQEIQKEDSWITDYENHSTDTRVKFVVSVSDETLFDNDYKKEDVIKKLFKLTSNKSLTNLHLYNRDGTIKKYDTIYQIMDEHFYTRYDMYKQRKLYQIDCLEKEISLLSSKLKFINYVIEDKIKVYKCSKQSIIDSLKQHGFSYYENGKLIEYKGTDKNNNKQVKTEYNYLLNLSVYSFTLEKVEELENDIEKLQKDLEIIVNTEEKDIWIRELDAFEQMYKNM